MAGAAVPAPAAVEQRAKTDSTAATLLLGTCCTPVDEPHQDGVEYE